MLGHPRRVSSGLTSRPSLSEVRLTSNAKQVKRVVGINLPTFVERPSSPAPRPGPRRVVGINLPTFVERLRTRGAARPDRCVSSGLTSRPSLSGRRQVRDERAVHVVSSGLTSRPSLSGCNGRRHGQPRPGVVGINLPTFVERRSPTFCARSGCQVSSGLTSRPSLSGRRPIFAKRF